MDVVERRNDEVSCWLIRTMLIFLSCTVILMAEAIAMILGSLGANGDIGFSLLFCCDSCVTGFTTKDKENHGDNECKPTEGDLDLLFEAMYDDFIGGQPSSAPRTAPAAQAPQVLQTPYGKYNNSMTTNTDTIICILSSTDLQILSQDVDELAIYNNMFCIKRNYCDNVPNAMFDAITFVNPFATYPQVMINPLEQSDQSTLRPVLTKKSTAIRWGPCASDEENTVFRKCLVCCVWVRQVEGIDFEESSLLWYSMEIKVKLDLIKMGLSCRCKQNIVRHREWPLKEVKRIFRYHPRKPFSMGLCIVGFLGIELTGFSDADLCGDVMSPSSQNRRDSARKHSLVRVEVLGFLTVAALVHDESSIQDSCSITSLILDERSKLSKSSDNL
ncbi:hypothetical protein Tco_0151472 [Tanacetum coccineum]